MTNAPLGSGDRVKVIIFFVIVLFPFFMFFGGIVVTLIVFASIYIMKKDKSFAPILNARKYINTYSILLVIGSFIVAMITWGEKDTILIVPFVLVTVAIFIWLSDLLFFKPMEEHKDWIVQHGIFSDKPNEKSLIDIVQEKLQSFQKPQSCGIADELLKWKSLLDQGVITEEEFNTKKEKLLK